MLVSPITLAVLVLTVAILGGIGGQMVCCKLLRRMRVSTLVLEQLVVTDRTGRTRATINCVGNGDVAIGLSNGSGEPKLGLAVGADARIVLFGDSGAPLVSMRAAGKDADFVMMDYRGVTRAGMCTADRGEVAELVLFDAAGKVTWTQQAGGGAA